MPDGAAHDVRIVHLETLIMHLQYDLEQLNSAVLSQRSELRQLRDQVARLERQLDLSSQDPERRDPLAERPPHY